MAVFLVNVAVLQWLENTGIALYLRQSIWVYPAVEIVHIIGFAVLVGAAFLFDLRLLGAARSLAIDHCIKHLIRWAKLSFLVVLPSGFLLFMVDATSMWMNSAFQLKLVLIVFAGINALLFHTITLKSVAAWNVEKMPPLAAKLAGLISIILWFGVIAAGRLIAYI